MALALLAAAPAVAAPGATIRTGGPSDPRDPKRATVLSAQRLVGRPFTVVDRTGRVVLRGRLRAATGRSAPWRHAAIADVGRLRRPGAYRIRVGRLVAPRAWVVTAEGAAASRAIRHLLRFYATNADGREPSPAHGPSHLHDATIVGGPLDGQHVDLTGGWMDAGDTLKFTQTTSFAVVALLAAARLAPADRARLAATADVGVRWLLRAHPAPGVFVSQVGEIVSDHDRDTVAGFDPADDDASPLAALSHRQALVGIGTDSGGRTAAALALAAQLEPDPARRALLVGEARAWYDAAGAAGALAPRLPEDPYPSESGQDDMALGAVELFRATGEPGYLADAIDWLDGTEPADPLVGRGRAARRG